MSGPYTSLLSLMAISTYICPTASYEISHIEKLQKLTCEAMYKRALDTRTEIDFSKPVGNLSCSPGPNGLVRYQCMINEDGHNIQFCGEWIWIEPGLCPRLYSLQGKINPTECVREGCPTDKYQSHMYYNFSVCFEQKDNDNKEGSKETQKGSSSGVNLGLVVALPICLAVVVIAIMIAVFVIWKRRKDGTKYMTDSEQHRLLYIPKQERPLNAAKTKLEADVHVLVTGLPGSGISTFLEHLKHECKFKNWQKVKYKSLKFETHCNGVVEIDHDIVKAFMKSNDLSRLRDRIEGADGYVFLMNVKYKWYRKNIDIFKRKLEIPFHVIDLSSDEYKPNNDEKREFIEYLCSEKGITEQQLSKQKRQDMSEFEGDNCGFFQILIEFLDEGEFENPIERMDEIDKRHKQ